MSDYEDEVYRDKEILKGVLADLDIKYDFEHVYKAQDDQNNDVGFAVDLFMYPPHLEGQEKDFVHVLLWMEGTEFLKMRPNQLRLEYETKNGVRIDTDFFLEDPDSIDKIREYIARRVDPNTKDEDEEEAETEN